MTESNQKNELKYVQILAKNITELIFNIKIILTALFNLEIKLNA